MSRQSAIELALHHLDSGDFAKVLGRRVAMATESEEAGQAPVLHAYLTDDIAPALTAMGFVCTTYPNPTGLDLPFLVADRIEDGNLPTLLLYGQGDVGRGDDRGRARPVYGRRDEHCGGDERDGGDDQRGGFACA